MPAKLQESHKQFLLGLHKRKENRIAYSDWPQALRNEFDLSHVDLYYIWTAWEQWEGNPVQRLYQKGDEE